MALPFHDGPATDTAVPRWLLWRMLDWLRSTTFAPRWLSGRWRHPLIGYGAALLLVAASVAISYLLAASLPLYQYPAALSFLIILIIATSWGTGPALLASLWSSLLLRFVLSSPRPTWALRSVADAISFAIVLAAGVAIGLVASTAEARRRQLAAERAELATILDLMPDELTVWDRRGRVVRANQLARRSQLVAPDGLLAPVLATLDLRTTDGHPIVPAEFPVSKALRGDPAPQTEVRLQTREGQQRSLLVQAVTLRDARGVVSGAITLSHDVTALREAEAERTRLLAASQRARCEAETAVRRLEALQTISDAALAHLSSRELLRELLARLKAAMGVDNTAILLATEDGRQLVVHMAHGPESEIAGQVHIPLGEGIAGHIAATQQPLIVEDLRTAEVANPFLKQTIRSLIGIPLVVQNRLVGVLHAGTIAPRHFTEDDLLLLRLAGDRIALALEHVRLYEDEQRLRREAADRAAELEAVFEAIVDGVFVFDRSGGVLRGNLAGRELLEMDKTAAFYARPLGDRGWLTDVQDAQGQPLPQQLWPLSRIMNGEVLKGEHTVDLKVRSRTGVERQLSVSGAPIRDHQGMVTGAVCVVRDVTERRRLVAQVVAERNRLQQVLDVLPEGIMIGDAQPPLIVAMNRTAEELLGLHLVGQSIPIPPPGAGQFAARHADGTPLPVEELPLERALLRGEVVRGEQFLLRNATTGREIVILANSAPLRAADGSIAGAVTVFQDITAIKDLERQREEFLATVSHDLKNPLTSILGLSQMLHRRVGRIAEPERTRFADSLDAIARTARQMATQINELLDLTRAQMGRPPTLELAPTDVVDLVAGLVEEYQHTTDRHTLRLSHDHETEVTTVDAARLHRALANLLANAIKYSPQGGEILVTVTRTADQEGTWLTITVADNGVGIPQSEVEHVFDNFYRASNVAGRFAGTGLGLSGVRQVVTQHGGTVALQSTEGVGTTVTVRLPLTP